MATTSLLLEDMGTGTVLTSPCLLLIAMLLGASRDVAIHQYKIMRLFRA